MNVHGRFLSRALSRVSVLSAGAVATALLPVVLTATAQAAPAGDPPGNNGTVKIAEHGDFDAMPDNDPHVGCTFDVEWYGFDQGDHIISRVLFEMKAPTGSVGLTVHGPDTVFVGGDPASGAGTPTGLDGRQTYTLIFDGPPHPLQGYHLKLTIATPGSQGSDKKYKVFWVEGCDPYVPPTPGISLEKSVADSGDAGTEASLGETLTYAFAVTNTGNVPLTDVTVTDPVLGMDGVPCVATLAPGESRTCPPRSYTVTAADLVAGRIHNTATASGSPPTGDDVSDQDDVTILTPSSPALVLDKTVADSADADSVGELGETLTYSFRVTNTGDVPLADVRLDDARLGMNGVLCAASLAVGAATTCTRTYVVTAADVTAGAVVNVATASGAPPTGGRVSDTDDATMPVRTAMPAITLVKEVTDSTDPDDLASLGETLTYTFTVTNTGTIKLNDVSLDDDMLGLVGGNCVGQLAVGETVSCPSQTYVVTQADVLAGSVHNTATVTGKSSGSSVTDDDDATIGTPSSPGIELVKSVADSADTGLVADAGEQLTYTFRVTNTGSVPLSDVVIDDPTLGFSDLACVPTLAVGVTATCPPQTYVVTGSDVEHGEIHNTATVTGTPAHGDDVTDEDDATIPTFAPLPRIFLDKQVLESDDADEAGSLDEVLTYTFDVTNTGNVDLTNVTLTDPMLGLVDAPCVAFLAAGATAPCSLLPTQTHAVSPDDVQAGSVENLATVAGHPPTGARVTDDDDAVMPTLGGPPAEVDLVVAKYAYSAVAAPGETVTYLVNVRNTAEGDAHDVVLTDTLPQGTSFVSATAPCTHAAGTVTCNLGTVAGWDDASVTITVTVDGGGSGPTDHSHHLDYTKVEAHLSVAAGETATASASCPDGYVATDGSVRLDHVDQGAGTFEDAVVLASRPTSDSRGWTGTLRNDSGGQVQAKVNVVCATERTSSGEDHSHPLVLGAPVTATRTFVAGRHDVDLSCPTGRWAIRPGFELAAGDATVTSLRTPGGWRFVVDVDDTAEGTFSVQCLSPTLGTVQGHSHDLRLEELTDSVSVPAGQFVETRLTCQGDQKGIVAWADLDPGLVTLGNDPQPVTRVFRFYNPTGAALTARFGLLCVSIRTDGGSRGDAEIVNTAHVTTSNPDTDHANDSDSVTVLVTPTGVDVAPRAAVVSAAGRTAVRLAVDSSSRRAITLTLVAAGKVSGTRIKAGSVLAHSRTKLRTGEGTVRLRARSAAVKALRSGKVRTARLVVVSHGHRDVRVVRLHR